MRKVIVIGLDGLEPRIVEAMLAAGRLPNLRALSERGGYGRIRTTYPAQTPVAWSSFATGTNPGGHGIFDFIRRDPASYLPDLALSRYEQKNAFLPPRAVNMRRGEAVWDVLSAAGIPSVVIRCPCTFPPDTLKGRMLSGMGVPDVRGGLGTPTFYSSAASGRALESENFVAAQPRDGRVSTRLIGPRSPKTGADLELDLQIDLDVAGRRVTIRSDGQPKKLEVRQGEWSDWLKVRFKAGLLQAVHGMARFHLVSLEPEFALYASPVNFDPRSPMFPISSPWDYAAELEREIGTYYSTGMVEDHTGITNGRFGEAAYLDQCGQVLRERERMLMHELDRFREGLLFCLFDTPDRLQHMLWRFREPSHPANRAAPAADLAHAVEEHYAECDAIVGRVLERADDDTLVIVLSDHGFGSFRRGVNLNTWLHRNGWLALKAGVRPGEEAGEFLRAVDWDGTRAYALGIGSVYVNVAGREGNGIVAAEEAPRLASELAAALRELRDPATGCAAVRSAHTRAELYHGICAADSPDVLVGFAEGYRASWATALGGVPAETVEDNTRRWSGDHIIDPALVPGVLFLSAPFENGDASLLDMAPTILAALGVPAGTRMEGRSLIA